VSVWLCVQAPAGRMGAPGHGMALPSGLRRPWPSSARGAAAPASVDTVSWACMLRVCTQSQRYIGCYASEEDAARVYDAAASQAHGPGAKRNFPGGTISEMPATVGEQKKQRSSSRYLGVYWNKGSSSWKVRSGTKWSWVTQGWEEGRAGGTWGAGIPAPGSFFFFFL
jgi:hypothetical protein